jgi:YVTN family beta-propeller protein
MKVQRGVATMQVIAWLVVLGIGGAGCGVAARERQAAVDVAASAEAGGRVVARVPLPDDGTDVTVGPDGRVWVTMASNKVVIVDPVAAAVTTTIEVKGEPIGIAVAPDGRRAYVADLLGPQVSVIDVAKAAVKTTIPAGTLQRPSLRPSAAVSRDGTRVFVGDTARDHLLVVATAADQIDQEAFLDFHPSDVAVGGDIRLVYVAGCRLSCIDGTLVAFDTRLGKVVNRIPLQSVPSGLVLTSDGRRAYVANGREASVAGVELVTQGVRTIDVNPEPVGIAISPDDRFVWVTSFQAGTLQAIATRGDVVAATLPVGRSPRAVAISPDGTRAYVTHSTDVLSIVDVSAVGR